MDHIQRVARAGRQLGPSRPSTKADISLEEAGKLRQAFKFERITVVLLSFDTY
jgi:hypothetical protein